jgi:hypothetical protein
MSPIRKPATRTGNFSAKSCVCSLPGDGRQFRVGGILICVHRIKNIPTFVYECLIAGSGNARWWTTLAERASSRAGTDGICYQNRLASSLAPPI